jgi:hypothetical protein
MFLQFASISLFSDVCPMIAESYASQGVFFPKSVGFAVLQRGPVAAAEKACITL